MERNEQTTIADLQNRDRFYLQSDGAKIPHTKEGVERGKVLALKDGLYRSSAFNLTTKVVFLRHADE